MHTAVHSHQAITSIPVNTQLNLLPDERQRANLSYKVNQSFAGMVLRINNRHLRSSSTNHPADIPGLTSTFRVKNSLIQLYSIFVNSDNDSCALAKVSIRAKQLFGHTKTLFYNGRLISLTHRTKITQPSILSCQLMFISTSDGCR